MAVQTITLIGAANVFGVHPRTIVRALTGEHNTYWYEDINEDVFAVSDIANAYKMDTAALSRCIEGRDDLITSDEAAELLGIKPRTFRHRVQDDGTNPQSKMLGKISNGGIVRYLRSKVLENLIVYSK